MNYPIHERFLSFQGEGLYAGRRAFFVRLYGCPVKCPWCDSAGTWHERFKPAKIPRMSAEEITEEARASGAEFVVVTGGEPAIHDLVPLVNCLREAGVPAHLETCGGFKIAGRELFRCVTVSPKWAWLPLRENLLASGEVKLIVVESGDVEKWVGELTRICGEELFCGELPPVWLHLEWSQRDNTELQAEIVRTVKTRGNPFRVGYQLHKLFAADSFDERSQPLVPLGGEEKNGF